MDRGRHRRPHCRTADLIRMRLRNTHSRVPIDAIRGAAETNQFHASQQARTTSLYDFQTWAPNLLSRRNSQTFSIGLSSGEYAGSVTSVMLVGTTISLLLACNPAPSQVSTARTPDATLALITFRCSFMASVLAVPMTRAAPTRLHGQMAP